MSIDLFLLKNVFKIFCPVMLCLQRFSSQQLFYFAYSWSCVSIAYRGHQIRNKILNLGRFTYGTIYFDDSYRFNLPILLFQDAPSPSARTSMKRKRLKVQLETRFSKQFVTPMFKYDVKTNCHNPGCSSNKQRIHEWANYPLTIPGKKFIALDFVT